VLILTRFNAAAIITQLYCRDHRWMIWAASR